MSVQSEKNLRIGVQLLLLALEAAPQLAPIIERGATKADLDKLASEDDEARAQLQALLDAGAPGG